MRLIRCASLSLILCGAPAFAAGGGEETHSSKVTAFSRIEAFAGQLFTTVKNVSQDLLPLVNAADEELARELRSDWPNIREEIRKQLSPVLPGHQPKSDRRH